jgi:hypothetical protein
MANHFDVYCVDRDFGRSFSNSALTPIVRIFASTDTSMRIGNSNGTESALRRGDNGVLRCDDANRLQASCDELRAGKTNAMLPKQLRERMDD